MTLFFQKRKPIGLNAPLLHALSHQAPLQWTFTPSLPLSQWSSSFPSASTVCHKGPFVIVAGCLLKLPGINSHSFWNKYIDVFLLQYFIFHPLHTLSLSHLSLTHSLIILYHSISHSNTPYHTLTRQFTQTHGMDCCREVFHNSPFGMNHVIPRFINNVIISTLNK